MITTERGSEPEGNQVLPAAGEAGGASAGPGTKPPRSVGVRALLLAGYVAVLGLATATWADPVAGGTECLPPGHPPVSSMQGLPPGHPPVGVLEGLLPPGHPPVRVVPRLPAGHPPIRSEPPPLRPPPQEKPFFI